MSRRSASCAFAAVALTGVLAACGGRQVTEEAPDAEPDACCIDDRWASPPPEIGQTPPDREAPADALEPFRSEPE